MGEASVGLVDLGTASGGWVGGWRSPSSRPEKKSSKSCLFPLCSVVVDSHLQQSSGPLAPGPVLVVPVDDDVVYVVVIVAVAVSGLLPVGAVRLGLETPEAEVVDGGGWCWCWGVWLTAAPVLEKLAVP